MAVNEHDSEQERPEDARIAALYRSAALEEPPERLDRVVREEARRPFEATVPERRVPWWHAWRVPLAFASVAVLSVSVVIIAQREGGEALKIEAPPQASQPPVPAPPVAPPAPESAAPQAAGPARSPPPLAPAARDRAAEGELAGRAQQRSPSATTTAPVDLEKRSREADAPRPQPFPGAEPPAADERREKGADRFMDRIESERAPATEPAPPVAKPKLEAPPPPAKPAPAPAAKPAPPPPPPPKSEVSPPAPRVEERLPAAKPMMRAPAESAAGSAVPPAAKRDSAQQPGAIAGVIAELEGRPPQQWIDRIVLLRAQGRREDADALLSEFRRRYPEEALPPDLR